MHNTLQVHNRKNFDERTRFFYCHTLRCTRLLNTLSHYCFQPLLTMLELKFTLIEQTLQFQT